jgi:hypothetical protein
VPEGGGSDWNGATWADRRRVAAGSLPRARLGEQCHFQIIRFFFKLTRLDSIKRWPYSAQKNLNRLFICRKLNKKQLYLLELFKIRYII